MSPAPRLALTVDVEDWHHPELVRHRARADGAAPSVVEEGTLALLELFRRHGARGTFFVLGEVASRRPALVRRIAEAGHEIACHGMTHRPLWALDPESFRRELREFRAAIRDALGHDPVTGFRAPTFSLDRSTAWALRVLAEEGFTWDSSVFPRRVRMYGVDGAPLGAYRPALDDPARHDPHGPIAEIPVTVVRAFGGRLPVAGGFYLRALPFGFVLGALARAARERACVLYIHPWECVARLPRIALPPWDALITYHGLGGVPGKLDRILARHSSDALGAVLAREMAVGAPTTEALR